LIPAIKGVRTVSAMDLKPAKDLIDKVHFQKVPTLVMTYINFKDAEKATETLSKFGCSTQITDHNGIALQTIVGNPEKQFPVGWDAASLATPAATPLTVAEVLKNKASNGIVSLKEAKALGQKVKGTSPGSVYYCVAYNDRVKVAARIYTKGTISVRAEWSLPTNDEMARINESGMNVQLNKGYASVHFQLCDVPAPRVIGAFLMGIGITWTEAVINAGQLVIE